MNNVTHIKAIKAIKKQTESTWVAPEYLHDILPATATVVMTFKSEKSMRSYRSMLYTINRQGDYRYRTIRDETSMYGIVIWRMK